MENTLCLNKQVFQLQIVVEQVNIINLLAVANYGNFSSNAEIDPTSTLLCVDETSTSQEMVAVVNQGWKYRGEGEGERELEHKQL